MENILPLNLSQLTSSRDAGDMSARPSTARSRKSTARSRKSKHSSRLDTSRTDASDPDFIDDDSSDSDEWEEEWVFAVDDETSVENAMRKLWKTDPKTFYVRGQKIMTMLEYKFTVLEASK